MGWIVGAGLILGLIGCSYGIINSTGKTSELHFLTPAQMTKTDVVPANAKGAKRYINKYGHVVKATKFEVVSNPFKGTILVPKKYKAANGKTYTYKLKDTKDGLRLSESSGGNAWLIRDVRGKTSLDLIQRRAAKIVKAKTVANAVRVEKIETLPSMKFYQGDGLALAADLLPDGATKNKSVTYRLYVYEHGTEITYVVGEAHQNKLVRDEVPDGSGSSVVWHFLSEIGERAAASAHSTRQN
jgi:hypothetical protein